MAILDFAKKGDVIVIAAGAETNAAKIGDLWLHWAKRIGVAGIVCDGLVRDVVGLLKADLPVFARGIAPNAGYKTGPGAINAEVSCGGVAIAPGDIVVGDRDGVVAIPRTQAAAVAKQLELVKQKAVPPTSASGAASKLPFWDGKALGERVRYVWIERGPPAGGGRSRRDCSPASRRPLRARSPRRPPPPRPPRDRARPTRDPGRAGCDRTPRCSARCALRRGDRGRTDRAGGPRRAPRPRRAADRAPPPTGRCGSC